MINIIIIINIICLNINFIGVDSVNLYIRQMDFYNFTSRQPVRFFVFEPKYLQTRAFAATQQAGE